VSALERLLLTSHERLIVQLSAGAYLLAQFLLSLRSQVHSLTIAKGRKGVVEEWATHQQNGSERRIERKRGISKGQKKRTQER